MPLPQPRDKEKKSAFVSRCVTELSDKKEFKDSKQRVAVCYNIFKEAKSKASVVLSTEEDETLFLTEEKEK
jgi:hypothetical protein